MIKCPKDSAYNNNTDSNTVHWRSSGSNSCAALKATNQDYATTIIVSIESDMMLKKKFAQR